MSKVIAQIYKPARPLSNFIELFWCWHDSTPRVPMMERCLPGGTVECVIRLAKDQTRIFDAQDLARPRDFPGAVVTGPQSRYFVLDKSEQDTLIGVHFKPGGAFPFFGVSAKELENTHVSLDSLWGRKASDLRTELIEAKSVEEKFQILERYLLSSLRPLTHHPAVEFALHQFQIVPMDASISEVADRVNLSPRRFIQVFSDQVGLTPKVFCRLQRFQEVLKLLHRQDKVDWLDLALSCGYFDQAHFIKDFQTFSGLNPTLYLAHRTDHLGHVPIL
jgi:AraC-like DNA-binding protein